jgi:hypothetical protein
MTGVANNQVVKQVGAYKPLYKTLDVSSFASVAFNSPLFNPRRLNKRAHTCRKTNEGVGW